MSLLQLLSLSNDVLYDALPYGLVCLGIAWTAKYIRFPDLTCSGTFVLGAAVAAVTIVKGGWPASAALVVAALAGVAGGMLTGLFYLGLRIDRILAGILSAFVLYSVNLLILTPTLPYEGHATLFTVAERFDRSLVSPSLAVGWHPAVLLVMVSVLLLVKVGADVFLASEMGLALRALEDEKAGETALLRHGLSPDRYRLLALGIGNGVIGIAGALVSFKEGAANANRGFDVLVTGLVVFLVGTQIHSLIERFGAWRRSRETAPSHRSFKVAFSTSAVLGAIAYFLLMTLSQRLNVDSAYAKVVLAGFVAITAADPAAFRSLRRRRESGTSRNDDGHGVLCVENLTYRYPSADTPTLNGVHLCLREGELVRLRGGNGSGKTTALRLMAGFFDPGADSHILFDGADVTWSRSERLRSIVYVDQDAHRGVVGALTPLENLALASSGIRPSPWRRALSPAKSAILQKIAEQGGMSPRLMDLPAAHLSGGQKQVVNLLTLLARPQRPKVVLLDEPANNLDAANQDKCRRIINSLHSEGVGLLVVSHSELPQLGADRDIDMDDINERLEGAPRVA